MDLHQKLRLANRGEWKIPESEVKPQIQKETNSISVSSDSDSDLNIPLDKLGKRQRHARQNSSDGDDIPLIDLLQD